MHQPQRTPSLAPEGRTGVDRVQIERDRVDVGEAAGPEGGEAIAQLLADSGGAQLRDPAQAGLRAKRLHIAHGQAAHERADDQRLQRLGRKEPLRLLREQLRGERSAASRSYGTLTSTSPSAVCRRRGRQPFRFPANASGLRSYRARPRKASNSSSTARWMTSLAPSRAAPTTGPRRPRRRPRSRAAHRSPSLSPPTAVRFVSSRRRSPFTVLSGLRGTYAVARTEPQRSTSAAGRDRLP